MYDRGIAIVAVTRRGVETALKIKSALEKAGLGSVVYAPEKYSQKAVTALKGNIVDFFKNTYSQVDALVGVMATGIIIRAVAPLLESKLTDPAVIGVDVSGRFVISLLSGHLGGANELTRIIAEGISATPVITTASDSMGKLSADELARTLHLSIQNPNSLVAVNSAIVNEGHVVVVLVGEVEIPLEAAGCFEVKKAQNLQEAREIINAYDAGLIITDETVTAQKIGKPVTILKPNRITVGLGARRDTPAEAIVTAVDSALERVHVPLSRVHRFATVDIKRNSKPMLDAMEKLGAPLEFLSVEALGSVVYDDLSPDSAMVQNKIGIGGVCERAALKIAGPNAKLILKKTKQNGVTVAVAEAE